MNAKIVENLLDIRSDKDKVNATESQLSDTEKQIDESMHEFRVFLEFGWAIFEAHFNGFRIIGRLL